MHHPRYGRNLQGCSFRVPNQICLFDPSLLPSLIDSVIPSFLPSFIPSFIHAIVHSYSHISNVPIHSLSDSFFLSSFDHSERLVFVTNSFFCELSFPEICRSILDKPLTSSTNLPKLRTKFMQFPTFIHPFLPSFIHSFPPSFIPPFIHPLIFHLFPESFIQLCFSGIFRQCFHVRAASAHHASYRQSSSYSHYSFSKLPPRRGRALCGNGNIFKDMYFSHINICLGYGISYLYL